MVSKYALSDRGVQVLVLKKRVEDIENFLAEKYGFKRRGLEEILEGYPSGLSPESWGLDE